MIRFDVHRAGRALLVVAVILFFAAPIAFGGGRQGKEPSRGSVAQVIKGPAKLLADLAVTQAKVERHVSSSILHAGVDLFTQAVRRLLRGKDRKDGDDPSGLQLRW